MYIESMRYFIELADAGSFYRASKKIFISQQGLSKAIKSLEAELGVKLLERGTRGIRLTKRGELFLEHAQKIVAAYDSMLDCVYAPDPLVCAPDERITVHASYYPTQLAASLFGQQEISQHANLIETPFKQLIEEATHSDGSELYIIDLYPQAHAKLKKRSDLVFDPIMSSQLGVAWLKGSPLDGSTAVHREQLAGMRIATNVQRDMAKLLEDVFDGFERPVIALGTANPRMTLEYARYNPDAVATFDSFGFMIAQETMPDVVKLLNFAPLSTPKSCCTVGVLYPKATRLSLRAGHMAAKLKSALEERYPTYFAQYPANVEGPAPERLARSSR